MLLQAMLGLQQDAPRGKLYVDPALPDWLPDVTLTELRLGRRRFDIRFWRDGDKTQWEVLKGNRDAVTRRSYAKVICGRMKTSDRKYECQIASNCACRARAFDPAPDQPAWMTAAGRSLRTSAYAAEKIVFLLMAATP
jgi:hypothetical protein